MFMALKRAVKIFTVSEYVKQDICNVFRISPKHILLTPNAVAPNFIGLDKSKVPQIMSKYNVQAPYIFYVGNAHPHKNVESLIKAFKIVHTEVPEMTLVLGGNKAFFYERIEAEILKEDYSKFIKFIGFVDDADLPYLYAGSSLFVNPSYREGFGIQILEAFATETKVACSNTSSLPEVGSDFAFYFDPYDANDIARTIIKALSERSEDKIRGGLARVQDYSWEASAKVVFKTIHEISNNL
jgi:alpha-1,3-rhamnosyl/mannosyltransferase